jgi:hypothetical protein
MDIYTLLHELDQAAETCVKISTIYRDTARKEELAGNPNAGSLSLARKYAEMAIGYNSMSATARINFAQVLNMPGIADSPSAIKTLLDFQKLTRNYLALRFKWRGWALPALKGALKFGARSLLPGAVLGAAAIFLISGLHILSAIIIGAVVTAVVGFVSALVVLSVTGYKKVVEDVGLFTHSVTKENAGMVSAELARSYALEGTKTGAKQALSALKASKKFTRSLPLTRAVKAVAYRTLGNTRRSVSNARAVINDPNSDIETLLLAVSSLEGPGD